MWGVRGAWVLVLAAALTACGGRKMEEVRQHRPSDAMLSCDHLAGELAVNRARSVDLVGEKGHANDNNAGMIAGAVLVPTMLLFLDLSDTEKKEAEALMARNVEVARLMRERECPGAPEEPRSSASAPASGEADGPS